jgi:hypothetical protein
MFVQNLGKVGKMVEMIEMVGSMADFVVLVVENEIEVAVVEEN